MMVEPAVEVLIVEYAVEVLIAELVVSIADARDKTDDDGKHSVS